MRILFLKKNSYYVYTFLKLKLPEEIPQYTGISKVKRSNELRSKRDVNLTYGWVNQYWPNAPVHYMFYYNSKVSVSANISNIHLNFFAFY